MSSRQRPAQSDLALPLLAVLDENGPLRGKLAADAIAERIGLDASARNEKIQVGPNRINAFDRDVRFAQLRAKLRGLTLRDDDGRWTLTQRGKNGLSPAAAGVVITVYESTHGVALWAQAEAVEGGAANPHGIAPGSIDLVLTSPPYDIETSKQYGGLRGRAYEDWLVARVDAWKTMIADTGSIMLNLGDAWMPGTPSMSLYQERVLLRLVDELGLHLAERLYWHNPAKLPTPASYVTVRRVRVTPAVEQIYWLAKDPDRCHGNNRNVLRPYSESMLYALSRGGTNAGQRPSGYAMSEGAFAVDNGGSIAHNIVTASNTVSNDAYSDACRANGLPIHPARFPKDLARFCVGLATEEGDTVFDPFGGSLTTMAVAMEMGRRAISTEMHLEYAQGGIARFDSLFAA
jgi:hypothetical protein